MTGPTIKSAAEYKEITFGQILRAMEKNGIVQSKDGWYQEDSGKMTACAAMQASINLEIGTDWFPLDTNRKTEFVVLDRFRVRIFDLNDAQRLDIPEIVKTLRKEYKGRLRTKVRALKTEYVHDEWAWKEDGE